MGVRRWALGLRLRRQLVLGNIDVSIKERKTEIRPTESEQGRPKIKEDGTGRDEMG